MTNPFTDLADFLDDVHLDLPIRGISYRITDPDADTALRLQNLVKVGRAKQAGKEVDKAELDDAEELDLYDKLIGPKVTEQMRADGVHASEIKRVARTVMVWVLGDLESAIKTWHSKDDDDPEGEARPNRATRRASAAAASTTRKPTRTSGTRATRTRKTA